MPAINMGSIMSKVRVYNRSVEGKLRMKEYINQCRADGRQQTYGGSTVITNEVMMSAAGKLIQLIQEAARSCGLPESVMNHLYNLDISEPIQRQDGSSVMYIYFSGDLRRESLEATDDSADYWASRGFGKHTGEGINNIVALFNNGYSKDSIKTVFGLWASTGEIVHNKTERDGLYFIQRAVDEFNTSWAHLYDATAIAGSEYQ